MPDSSLLQGVIDLTVKRCDIVSAVGSVSVKGLIVELNYFEDMFSNCISGSIIINDSSSYHQLYSWCGDEYLILSFSRPDNPNPVNKIFRVYSISNRRTTKDTNENYILNFCSEELFLSQRIRVSKTYKSKRISDIVKDIAFTYLKIDPNEFPDSNIEDTFGSYDITIPNLKPLQAINWLCNLAISNKLPKNKLSGASYLFWQTKNGYYFKSILGLFNDIGGGYGSSFYSGYVNGGFYWYGMKNVGLSSLKGANMSNSNQLDDRQQIISYKNLNTYDSLENARKSVFSNKLVSLDYLTRTYRENIFDYNEYFNNYLSSNIQGYKGQNNSLPIMSNFKDRFGKTHNEYPEAIIKISPTTTGQNLNDYIKKNQPDIKDYNVEYTIPYRIAQLGLLGMNRYKLVIPGDPNITVGKIIDIKMPQTAQDDKGNQNMDRFLSGKYLVTCVRHMLNQNNEYQTILEVRKDSYESSTINKNTNVNGLAAFDNNNSSLKSLKSKNSF